MAPKKAIAKAKTTKTVMKGRAMKAKAITRLLGRRATAFAGKAKGLLASKAAALKQKEKAKATALKEKAKAIALKKKEKEKAAALKEKEKARAASLKEKERAKAAALKEREKARVAAQKAKAEAKAQRENERAKRKAEALEKKEMEEAIAKVSKFEAKELTTGTAASSVVPKELRSLKAFVVNLDSRKDRWERCEEMLKKETPWLEYERFSASHGKTMTIPEDEICMVWNTSKKAHYGDYDEWVYDAPGSELDGKQWRWKGQEPKEDDKEWSFEKNEDDDCAGVATNKLTNEHWNVKKVFAERFLDPGQPLKMSPGERGCAHSHRRLWEVVAKRSEPTLVLEDDVKFTFTRSDPDLGEFDGKLFTERLAMAIKEAPSDFDVLYLGWSGWRGGNFCLLDEEDHGKAIRKAEYVWTTVAYVITPAAARKLLEAARPMYQPVDEFMAWEASQGRLKSFVVIDEGDADEEWAGGIVDQADFFGDSDIKKSDGGCQGDKDDCVAEFSVQQGGA